LQDYLAYRFESPNAIRVISSLAVLTTSLIYLVGQYTAIAIVLKWLLGIPQTQALFIGALIVVIYVLLGGLYAVSWTTLFQGFIIFFGVLIMAPFVIKSAGGLSTINASVAAIDPNLIMPFFPRHILHMRNMLCNSVIP
jgi:SSS family solute:Na+ symporter